MNQEQGGQNRELEGMLSHHQEPVQKAPQVSQEQSSNMDTAEERAGLATLLSHN